MNINKDELSTKRQGFKAVEKFFKGNDIKTRITASFKTYKNLPIEEKTHLDLLPSTCFI